MPQEKAGEIPEPRLAIRSKMKAKTGKRLIEEQHHPLLTCINQQDLSLICICFCILMWALDSEPRDWIFIRHRLSKHRQRQRSKAWTASVWLSGTAAALCKHTAWDKHQGEGRAISDERDFPRRTNGCKGSGKALPAEVTGSATVTALPGIVWTQTSPSGAAGGLACALVQRMGTRSNSKPVGLPRCAWAAVCSQDSGQHPSACQGHHGSQHEGFVTHGHPGLLCLSSSINVSGPCGTATHSVELSWRPCLESPDSKQGMGCLYAASSSDYEMNIKN